MDIIIEKATNSDYNKCFLLSEKYCMKNVKDKTKGFIGSPLNKDCIQDLYCAKLNGEIAGMVVIRNLDQDDAEFYEIDMPVKAKIIEKLLVDEKFRKCGIGNKLIQFAIIFFSDYEIFADVSYSPFRNMNSENCFIKNNFKLINIVPYFKKELYLQTEWSVYKFDKDEALYK